MTELHALWPLAGRLLLAAGCGAALGYEREILHKPAGLRTNMLIALGSALFTHASLMMTSGSNDPTRIAAQIVTGIGFLGAGTIMRGGKDMVSGLTSAATVWVTASLGILAGAGYAGAALLGVVLAYIILQTLRSLEMWRMSTFSLYRLTFEVDEREEGVQSWLNMIFHRTSVQLGEMKIVPGKDGERRFEVEYTAIRKVHERILKSLQAELKGIRSLQSQRL